MKPFGARKIVKLPDTRPLARSSLPHRMSVRVPLAEGGFSAPRLVCPVRFERLSDGNGVRADVVGQVFVDAKNSTGAFEVPVGARVVVNEHAFEVVDAMARCDLLGRVHYWLLDVVAADMAADAAGAAGGQVAGQASGQAWRE